MPDNNRKILSNKMIEELEQFYYFIYDKEKDTITTKIVGCERKAIHEGNKPFEINSKRFRKKITFSVDCLNIWKQFQEDPKLSKYSLFEVNNTFNKLRIMYQQPDAEMVANMLKSNFSGIKRI